MVGLSVHGTDTRLGLVIHKLRCIASPVHSDSGQVETRYLILSLLYLQGLEVTVHKATLQLYVEALETEKLLLFLHGLMQFSIWKIVCSCMVSLCMSAHKLTYLP